MMRKCYPPQLAGTFKVTANLLTLLFTFLALSFLAAQPIDVDINWGNLEKAPGDSRLDEMVASGPWGAWLIRKDDRRVWLERYDKQQRLLQRDLLPLGRQDRFRDFIVLGQRTFMLYSRLESKTGLSSLWCQELDKYSLSLLGEARVIADMYIAPNSRRRPYDLVYAQDSSKLLVYYQQPSKRQSAERFSLTILGEGLQSLWQQDVILPYADELFQIREYRIDPSGRVFILGRLYRDRPRPTRDGEPNYRYMLLSTSGPNEKLWEYEIALENLYISDLTFRMNRFGNLLCSGLYGEAGDQQVRGAYYFRIDPSIREVYDVNLLPFELSFISAAYRENERRFGEKGSPELYQYRMRRLIQRSDGGSVLVAEQYFVEEINRRGPIPGSFVPERKYHYNDIIVVNIAPGGRIEWAKRIPKRQVTMNDGGYSSGFGMATVQDRLYFIYNDNARNFGPRADVNRSRNYSHGPSVLAVTELQRDGQMRSQALFDLKDAKVRLRPRLSQQTGPAEVLLYGESNRKYRMLRLGF